MTLGEDAALGAWRAQLRKGATELAVLALLEEDACYGVKLLERVRVDGGFDLSEGSIYPLLNRLQREGKITAEWVEDPDATHPRKYYALTDEGRLLLAAMKDEWRRFATGMRRIVGEGG